jgi:hypothetical protein
MNWKVAAEFIGITAIVASLVFVGMQLRLDREIATVEALSLRFDHADRLANLVADNNKTWVKAIEGEQLSAEEDAVTSMIANAMEERYRVLYYRFERLGPFNPDSVAQAFAFYLHHIPVLRRHYEIRNANEASMRSAYSAGRQTPFEVAVDASLELLADEPIQKLHEGTYVFW